MSDTEPTAPETVVESQPAKEHKPRGNNRTPPQLQHRFKVRDSRVKPLVQAFKRMHDLARIPAGQRSALAWFLT